MINIKLNTFTIRTILLHSCAALLWLSTATHAAETNKHTGHIIAKSSNAKLASFDIVHAKITHNENGLQFSMQVSQQAGAATPTSNGKLAGSDVFSYVWPTKIDSTAVGFEPAQGILAMAITSHPDFDDTPLFDENGDGNLNNASTHAPLLCVVDVFDIASADLSLPGKIN